MQPHLAPHTDPTPKSLLLRRYAVVVGLTLLTALSILLIRSNPPLENHKLFQFPLAFSSWQGQDIPMEPWVFESLETPFAIMRDYRRDDGTNVNMVIIWYDDKEIAFHAPEACLGGVGNLVKSKQKRIYTNKNHEAVEVTELLTERSGQQFLVNYYFVNHHTVTDSQIKARWEILVRRLMMQRADIAMVRLIVPISAGIESARAVCESFFWDSLPDIYAYATVGHQARNH